MHKINTAGITADEWKLAFEAVKSSSNYLTIFPSNGNLWKSFWAMMSLSISVPYRFRKIFHLFLAIVADIIHSKPKHTCMTRIKLVTALHEMCILIFAFRGCYYLAHLYCKICFKSQSILQNFPRTSFVLDILWRRARSDFNCLQTVGRFLSRVSDYLSSYVFLLRRRSFATRKVYISLETLLLFCRYPIELMFLELDV